MKKIRSFPIYPFLFVVYPALALVGNNVNEVEASVLWRPLFVLLAVTAVLLPLLYAALRDWHRAALALTILGLLFFTYGHLYLYLKKIELAGFVIGRHRQMLPVWMVLGGLGVWWAGRKVKTPAVYAPVLNVVMIFLLVFPTYQTVSYSIQRTNAQRAALESAQGIGADLPLGYAPDIYYIILDAYGRADVLQEMLGYDNMPFIKSLQARGFYVAECSQSNYAQTMLSLTSSLNFDYLDSLTSNLTADTDTRAPLRALGQYNNARKFLTGQGYNIVSFSTNFPVSEWEDANYFLRLPPEGMNDFEIALAQTSIWRAPMDLMDDPLEKRSAEWYRRRTLFTLGQMTETVPEIPGPKFVFTHLIIPHHPFVFKADGSEVNAFISEVSSVPEFDVYKIGYVDQLEFINTQIELVVQHILETSPNPPIIIIQGDHGPAPFDVIERRMKNLNVYYFPDGAYENLYPSITPVNTFRVIFNQYFGQAYPLLDDISYYSAYDIPYNYEILPGTCP